MIKFVDPIRWQNFIKNIKAKTLDHKIALYNIQPSKCKIEIFLAGFFFWYSRPSILHFYIAYIPARDYLESEIVLSLEQLRASCFVYGTCNKWRKKTCQFILLAHVLCTYFIRKSSFKWAQKNCIKNIQTETKPKKIALYIV